MTLDARMVSGLFAFCYDCQGEPSRDGALFLHKDGDVGVFVEQSVDGFVASWYRRPEFRRNNHSAELVFSHSDVVPYRDVYAVLGILLRECSALKELQGLWNHLEKREDDLTAW